MSMTGGDDGTFQGRLLPGERMRWTGRPATGLLFSQRDWGFIPFSLIFLGFAIYMTFFVQIRGDTTPISGISILFVLIGLYFLVGRFAVDSWARVLTRYAVTDQRILIARGAPFTKFTAINIDTITEMDIKEDANGRGTIRFGPEIIRYTRKGARSYASSPSFDLTPQFLAIENARTVFDMVQRETTRDKPR